MTPNKITECTVEKQLCEWISVDERLPKSNTPVLVFYLSGGFKNPSQNVALYFDGIEWRSLTGGYRFDNSPSHWMPLPNPPLAALNGEEL